MVVRCLRSLFANDSVIYLLPERKNVSLTRNLLTDIKTPGTYHTGSQLGTFAILAPMNVTGYLIHYDPTTSSSTTPVDGSVTFSYPVLGIIVTSARLSSTSSTGSSDLRIGNAGVTFPTDADNRGVEFNTAGTKDSITLSADYKTVTIHFKPDDFGPTGIRTIDEIRIIEAVPEPSTLALMGLGFSWLLLLRRKNWI